jgi:hypothetical protein
MHRAFHWESAVASRCFCSCTALEIEVLASASQERKELVQWCNLVQHPRNCFKRQLYSVQIPTADELVQQKRTGMLRTNNRFSLALQFKLTSFRRPNDELSTGRYLQIVLLESVDLGSDYLTSRSLDDGRQPG